MTTSLRGTTTKAAAIALAIGAAILIMPPAFGQAEPLSTFSLELGDRGAEAESQAGDRSGRGDEGAVPSDDSADNECLADREIRVGLNDYGFEDVEIRRSLGPDRVEVHAIYGRWIYGMQIDRCNGKVDGVERVRRATGGGFGLHFNYGSGY